MRPLLALRMAMVFLQFGMIPPLIVCGLAEQWVPMFGFAGAGFVVGKINLALGAVR